jgi:hypothetical protein
VSEKFLDRFLGFFFGFVVLLIFVLTTIMLILLWISSQNLIFYYGYIASLGFSVFYGIKIYLEFQNFRENLYLFLPNSEKQLEPLSIDIQDLPLKVCLYYRNGATLESMKEDFGLKHPNQVRRLLIEGLDILLKEHNAKVKQLAK